MAKSIRVSDDLYNLAATQARLMHRSLAQQVEYWASLGQALEQSGELEEAQRTILSNMHEINRERVRRGQLSARSLHMIPAKIAREAVLVFPDVSAFVEDEKPSGRAKKQKSQTRRRAKPIKR